MRRGGDMSEVANFRFTGELAKPASKPSRGARRAISPLTLRLTAEERARLEELAAGMTLSTYVALDGDTERRVSFDPRTYQHFDHGYAVTIHKSQGATVDAAYVLASRSMDKHLAYVAMTRHRDKLQIYSACEDQPRWMRHIDRDHRYALSRAGPSLG